MYLRGKDVLSYDREVDVSPDLRIYFRKGLITITTRPKTSSTTKTCYTTKRRGFSSAFTEKTS